MTCNFNLWQRVLKALFFIRAKERGKKQTVQWEIVQQKNALYTVQSKAKQSKRNAQSCSFENGEKLRYIIVVI